MLGGGGEGEEAEIGLFAALGHAAEEGLHFGQPFVFSFLLCLGAQLLAAEDALQFGGGFAGL